MEELDKTLDAFKKIDEKDEKRLNDWEGKISLYMFKLNPINSEKKKILKRWPVSLLDF